MKERVNETDNDEECAEEERVTSVRRRWDLCQVVRCRREKRIVRWRTGM